MTKNKWYKDNNVLEERNNMTKHFCTIWERCWLRTYHHNFVWWVLETHPHLQSDFPHKHLHASWYKNVPNHILALVYPSAVHLLCGALTSRVVLCIVPNCAITRSDGRFFNPHINQTCTSLDCKRTLPGENPCRHKKNMPTPHKKGLGQNRTYDLLAVRRHPITLLADYT